MGTKTINIITPVVGFSLGTQDVQEATANELVNRGVAKWVSSESVPAGSLAKVKDSLTGVVSVHPDDLSAVRGALAFASVSANGVDDTAAIQEKIIAALNSPILAKKVISLHGAILVSSFTLGSGVYIDATNASVTQISGADTHMVTNTSAYTPIASSTDAATTSGTNVITSSLGALAFNSLARLLRQ